MTRTHALSAEIICTCLLSSVWIAKKTIAKAISTIAVEKVSSLSWGLPLAKGRKTSSPYKTSFDTWFFYHTFSYWAILNFIFQTLNVPNLKCYAGVYSLNTLCLFWRSWSHHHKTKKNHYTKNVNRRRLNIVKNNLGLSDSTKCVFLLKNSPSYIIFGKFRVWLGGRSKQSNFNVLIL